MTILCYKWGTVQIQIGMKMSCYYPSVFSTFLKKYKVKVYIDGRKYMTMYRGGLENSYFHIYVYTHIKHNRKK